MIAQASRPSPRLRQLLREVLDKVSGDGRAQPGAIDPRALARRIHIERGDWTGAWTGDGAARAAERELLRVHRAETSYLLRRAAALRGSVLAPGAPALETWRACMREQLACMALDRLQVSGELERVLERCTENALESWPSAVELARASLALHDVESGRVALAEALLAAGAARDAASAFASALERSVHGANFGRLLDGLIEAQRRLGHSGRVQHLADCATSCANAGGS